MGSEQAQRSTSGARGDGIRETGKLRKILGVRVRVRVRVFQNKGSCLNLHRQRADHSLSQRLQ